MIFEFKIYLLIITYKMEAQLAHAMLSIPATKGFEIGSGNFVFNFKGLFFNTDYFKTNILR